MLRSILLLGLALAPVLEPPATLVPLAVGEVVEDYWSNGSLRRRYDLDDKGRKHGNYTEFYEDGELALRARYRAGELDGAYATFYEDGAKHVYTGYRAGKLHGKYTEREPSGALHVSAAYKDGELDGVRTLYADKKVASEQRWKKGALLDIDGVAPFPRALEDLARELFALRAATPERAGPDAPEAERLATERLRGLERLKEYRALIGLRYDDLHLVDDFNDAAQWGSRLCHAIGGLDHTPDNPGWDEAEYQRGYRGTSHSNLATVDDVARSIDMYMDDSDASNIDRVGHRMHCIAGALKATGFGSFEGFSAMWSMDRGGKSRSLDVAAYPPAGYVPSDRFHDRIAWSLSFDAGFRRVPDVAEVEVRVRALDERYFPVGEPLPLDHQARLGTHTLVFRPVGLSTQPGSRYGIEIDGLSGGKRGEAYRYFVEFVDLDEFLGPADPQLAAPGDSR